MQKFSLRIFKGTFSLMASQTGFVENDLSNATNNTVKAIYFSDIWKKRDMQITFWLSPVSLLGQKNWILTTSKTGFINLITCMKR